MNVIKQFVSLPHNIVITKYYNAKEKNCARKLNLSNKNLSEVQVKQKLNEGGIDRRA